MAPPATTPTTEQQLRAAKREVSELKKALKALSLEVSRFLANLDHEMTLPSNAERGRRLAKLAGELDFANDRVRFFSLGVDWRTAPKKRKGPY